MNIDAIILYLQANTSCWLFVIRGAFPMAACDHCAVN